MFDVCHISHFNIVYLLFWQNSFYVPWFNYIYHFFTYWWMNLVPGWAYILSWTSHDFSCLCYYRSNFALFRLDCFSLRLFRFCRWIFLWLLVLLLRSSWLWQLLNRSWLLLNWIWLRLIISLARWLFLLY